jgi:hypothetical protein
VHCEHTGRPPQFQHSQKEYKNGRYLLLDSGQEPSAMPVSEGALGWLITKDYKIKQNKDLFTDIRLAESLFEEVK